MDTMLVSYDLRAGATYVEVSMDEVARTVTISDSVMVDLNAHHEPVGVEFLTLPAQITDTMLGAVADRFPTLKYLADRTWLEPAHA